jgi:hypothetical protein
LVGKDGSPLSVFWNDPSGSSPTDSGGKFHTWMTGLSNRTLLSIPTLERGPVWWRWDDQLVPLAPFKTSPTFLGGRRWGNVEGRSDKKERRRKIIEEETAKGVMGGDGEGGGRDLLKLLVSVH